MFKNGTKVKVYGIDIIGTIVGKVKNDLWIVLWDEPPFDEVYGAKQEYSAMPVYASNIANIEEVMSQDKLKHRDVVEITLQGFVETDGEGPGGVAVAFYDAYGNREITVVKRQCITKVHIPTIDDTVKQRPISQKLLDEFDGWTRTADMFRSSTQGMRFAEEMRAVINLARKMVE